MDHFTGPFSLTRTIRGDNGEHRQALSGLFCLSYQKNKGEHATSKKKGKRKRKKKGKKKRDSMTPLHTPNIINGGFVYELSYLYYYHYHYHDHYKTLHY